MADFAKAAKEIFQVLQTFDYTMSLYDADGQEVTEPEEARQFFDRKANLLVLLTDDDDNSKIELRYGKSTHANDIFGLDQSLGTVAPKYALMFSANQFGKEIDPKSVREDRKMPLNNLTEGMYGTTKSSYLRLEQARMIVRHSKRIDDCQIGARGRYVESIFIENALGERFLFPGKRIAPARAMTQHVNHGGSFGDEVGGEIMRKTNEYANLGHAASFVNSNAMNLAEGAMAVREACRANMRKLRKTFERLSRSSSYAVECGDMMEKSKSLNETDSTISETRIMELRQLLSDADLPKEVYECACKAMDRMKEDAPITEEDDDAEVYTPPEGENISVLGILVNRDAWDKFKKGFLLLTMLPQKPDEHPEFRDKNAIVTYRIGNLIPVLQDSTMANLLDQALATISMNDGRKGSKFENMLRIAVHALKAKKVLVPQGPRKTLKKKDKLTTKNEAIQEHMSWLERFEPDRIFMEDFGMGSDLPLDAISGEEEAKNDVISEFDAEDFVGSPEMADVTQDRNPDHAGENRLSHEEIVSALSSYLQRHIETYTNYLGSGFSMNTDEMVDAVIGQASEALQEAGWIVETSSNEEAGMLDEDLELTMSDFMIPKADQGASLKKQVTKRVVKDPNTGEMHPPDAGYVDQISHLGWTNYGPPR